jgi:hypothetical protein
VCSTGCAQQLAFKARLKKEAKDATAERMARRAAKEKIKTRSDYVRDTQLACNAYIRRRDHGKPCISCGKATKDGDHAGHWKPTSTSPELRFNELNIHLQCIQCNLFLHGNVAEYRIGLIERIGIELVQWMEGSHDSAHYSIDDLLNIKEIYKNKFKSLV